MYQAGLDSVFSALADPTRRAMLERLARGRLSVGEVANGFAISQPAASKHVKILERSGLVQRTIAGRTHHLQLTPSALQAASTWIERQRAFWNAALDRLGDVLTTTTEGD